MTAEEFYREKIRNFYDIRGQMDALWRYEINAELALRWAHEFSILQYNQAIDDAAKSAKCQHGFQRVDRQSILKLKK